MVKKKKHQEAGDHLDTYPSLPVWELRFYVTVHVGIVIFICYCVYKASKEYDGLLNLYDFEPGWSILGREKDISNFEWTFFYKYFWNIWPWYIGHVALSKIALWNFNQYRKVALTVYSLLTLTFVLGWRVITLFLAHCIAMYAISFFQSPVVVWVVSLGLLSTLNFEPFVTWMKLLNTDDEQGSFIYLLMFTLAFAQLRYTSFCLEKVKYHSEELVDKGNNLETRGEKVEDCVQTNIKLRYYWTDLLFYVFYFPLFFTGPMMSYRVFSNQLIKPPRSWTKARVLSICFGFTRVIFWAFINEVVLHYFYFNALQHSSASMRMMDLWTLAGIGYCSGQFFMNKYTVLFGWPSNVAKLDHLDPPRGPKCVSYIYLYSDMWKYFDRGMYDFIKRYIYIPMGGSRVGVIRQFIGAVVAFMFVYFWHGLEYYVFIWTLFNFIGISLEALGTFLGKHPAVKAFEMEFLSPASVRRVHALVAVPVFVMSAFTAFCFFGGSSVGYTFYERFIYRGSPEKLLVVVGLLYCCIQVGMEVKRWEYKSQQVKKG